jgi:hypothetical protein
VFGLQSGGPRGRSGWGSTRAVADSVNAGFALKIRVAGVKHPVKGLDRVWTFGISRAANGALENSSRLVGEGLGTARDTRYRNMLQDIHLNTILDCGRTYSEVRTGYLRRARRLDPTRYTDKTGPHIGSSALVDGLGKPLLWTDQYGSRSGPLICSRFAVFSVKHGARSPAFLTLPLAEADLAAASPIESCGKARDTCAENVPGTH